jgi:hypothetical protein
MADPLRELEQLSTGFRRRYLRYDELTSQLQTWADRYPSLVRLDSVGRTPEGRELWLLTIGPEPDRQRPAVWVDGNLHAIEFAGSSVALAIAEDVMRLHLAPDKALHGLPMHLCDAVRRVLFHVMPRISPDGAEQLLTSGRYVRSVPRDDRVHQAQAHWIGADVDGDGQALLMRKADPAGEYVESGDWPGLMLRRRVEDERPFYKLYPEGFIEHFNGRDIPTPHLLSDNAPDLNRNFPYRWAPEHEQVGAGPYPASEPETRAVVDFATSHPNLFTWLNLHTVGGVFIRPPGSAPDIEMNRADLALYRQVATWAEEITGYPTVCGYEEYSYQPETPLRGNLSDYVYHQRGCLALACELWDLFAQLGIPRKRPFVDHYTHVTDRDALQLARWDREHNASRIFREWRRVDHPQLGEVEVGGFDQRIGLTNPPYDKLPEICDALSALWLRVASLAPHIEISEIRRQSLGENTTRLEAAITNLGYLPTYILQSAREIEWNGPLYANLHLEGCELAEPGEAHREIGHLDGWGRGLFGEEAALFDPRSRGSTSRRFLIWTIRGHGTVALRVGSPRTGFIEQRIDL